MTRFIAAGIMGLLLSFGHGTFFHYQLATSGSPSTLGMVGIFILVATFTGVNFYLSFWNLAGFANKPPSWKYFESQGIPYTLKRDNINILFFLGLSFLVFAVLSFGLDGILGNGLGLTIKGIFYSNGAAELIKDQYYWFPNYWFLFVPLYGTSLISGFLIFLQAKGRLGESEIKESEFETKEEDK